MPPDISVRVDPVESAAIIALLERHLELMRSQTPPEHVHALDLAGLRSPDVTLWAAWRNAAALGCVALKALDGAHGEIKSMHVLAASRGAGTGSLLLRHVVDEASRRGYERLSLETGVQPGFEAARAFYRRHGFIDAGPFGDYVENDWSVFMTRQIGG